MTHDDTQMGDLNYRLDSSKPVDDLFFEARNQFTKMIPYDQLSYVRNQNLAFSGFHESPITFPPTYKFLKGQSEYDDRKDHRVRTPAWCDRILYQQKESLNGTSLLESQIYNWYGDACISDHKPVFSRILARSKRVDEEKLSKLRNTVRKQIENHDGGRPHVYLSSTLLSFGEVQMNNEMTKEITIANESNVNAYVEVLSDEKEWISIHPRKFLLLPKEQRSVRVSLQMTPRNARVGLSLFRSLLGHSERLRRGK